MGLLCAYQQRIVVTLHSYQQYIVQSLHSYRPRIVARVYIYQQRIVVRLYTYQQCIVLHSMPTGNASLIDCTHIIPESSHDRMCTSSFSL